MGSESRHGGQNKDVIQITISFLSL